MSYLNVISVSNAKDYLGVDDTSRDAEIERMIVSALKYLEKRTNIIMMPFDKKYIVNNGCIRIYDYPINTLEADLPTGVRRTIKRNYSIYYTSADTITLNVGNDAPDSDILEAAFMLIDHYFNEGDRMAVPKSVEDIININRRFII